MVFSSVLFVFVFLPTVIVGSLVLRKELQNIFLLTMSLLFYAYGEPKYIVLIIASIIINYMGGIGFAVFKNNFIHKITLTIVVMLNLGLLFYFKYFDFGISTVNSLFSLNLPLKEIILPIGISFYTFQGLSYVIDVYRKKVEVQKNPINIALYITLFPQLIAGPIVRYSDINRQINNRTVTFQNIYNGTRRFIIGLSKKMLIANYMGSVADKVFLQPALDNTPSQAWVGIIAYSFQIFFDFSGYSDMAIGIGEMLGFKFLENFNFPYISKNMTEFWRRWHISLSTWFKDYLYIPLGGNRKGNVYINLLIVFFATGLWHGASMNFVVWGLWNGLFLIIERLLRNSNCKIKLPTIIKRSYTLLVIIVGWVFFRAVDLTYAFDYIKIMFGLAKPEHIGFTMEYFVDAKIILVFVFAIICSIPIGKYIKEKIINRYKVLEILENISLVILLFLCTLALMTQTINSFIYFRF